MRKNLIRLARRVLSPQVANESYEADFDDAAEMVVIARALRAHGYGARFSDTPLRLVVTIPGASRTSVRLATAGSGR